MKETQHYLVEAPSGTFLGDILDDYFYRFGSVRAIEGIEFPETPQIGSTVLLPFGNDDEPLFAFMDKYYGDAKEAKSAFYNRLEYARFKVIDVVYWLNTSISIILDEVKEDD